MGIYHDFIAEKHEPCYGSCSYWGSQNRGYNDFLLNPNGRGWHLDRSRFNRFLAKKAVEMGAELRIFTTFKASKKTANGYRLTLSSQNNTTTVVQTQIVVDASGQKTAFATTQNAQKVEITPIICLSKRYQQVDSHTTISKLTHLEASKYGWWYAALLPNQSLLVAFYTNATSIKKVGLNKNKIWEKHLKKTISIQKLTQGLSPMEHRPKGFPAPSYILDKISGKHWLAIGDAASAYDPITAQGITKAMFTALEAAPLIVKRLNNELTNFRPFDIFIIKQFEQYLAMRSYFYQQEQRWKGSPFWQQFHQLYGS